MANLLNRHWREAEAHAITVIPYWKDDPDIGDPASISLILAQVGFSVHAEHRVARLVQRCQAGTRVLRFPFLSCPVFWPFAIQIRNPRQEPGFSKPRFPWGDRCLIDLIRGGVPPEEALAQYLALDVPLATAIDRIFDRWTDRFRQLEAACDVGILDYLQGVMFRRRSFVFHDDVEAFIVRELLDRCLSQLKLPRLEASAGAIPKRVPQREMPVHPSVIRHFGLEYLSPSYQYGMPWGERLTHRDWVRAYIDYLVADPANVGRVGQSAG